MLQRIDRNISKIFYFCLSIINQKRKDKNVRNCNNSSSNGFSNFSKMAIKIMQQVLRGFHNLQDHGESTLNFF